MPPSAWSSSPCPPAATSSAPPWPSPSPRSPAPSPRASRALRPRPLAAYRARVPVRVASWIAALALLGLIACGFLGPPRPARATSLPLDRLDRALGRPQPSPACSSATSGARSTPGPARPPPCRRRLGRTGAVGLARLGPGPPSLGLLAFAWFEIVSLAPDDPAVLARAALAYWLVILAARRARGPGLARAAARPSPSSSASSPASPRSGASRRRPRAADGRPARRPDRSPCRPLDPGAAAFVALILATVSFDGLHDTFWWLARLGVNPLEFPGRSAVTGANTARPPRSPGR